MAKKNKTKVAIFNAVLEGNLDKVIHLIKNGANLNLMGKYEEDDYEKTALIIAAQKGYLEICKELIKSGADVNIQNNFGSNALMFAAQSGHLEVCKELIKTGVDLNIKGYSKWTALMFAAQSGHLEICEELIKNGADLNVKNKCGSALIIAATKGFLEICSILIKNGADLNVKGKYGEDNNEKTALMTAAQKGYLEICKELIKNGVYLNIKNDYKSTALMFAAQNGHLEICKELIKNGADLHFKNNGEKTALMYAAENNHLEISQLLSDELLIEKPRNDEKNELEQTNNNIDSQKEILRLKAKLNNKDQIITHIQTEITNLRGELSDEKQNSSNLAIKITKSNEENLELKQKLVDLTDNCENVEWLIRKAKEKHLKFISQTNIDSNIDNYNNSNVQISIESINNSLKILNEFSSSKKLGLMSLLEELRNDIEKSKIHVKLHFDESQMKLEQQQQHYETNETNFDNCSKKLNDLFDEIIRSQNEMISLRKEKIKAKENIIISQREFSASKLIYEQSEKIVKEISDIEKNSYEFVEKWNQKISQGNIESWDDELILGLLEYCNLDEWFSELKTQVLSDIKICDIQHHHLMTLKKNIDEEQQIYRKMTWGEAKYLCLVIEEIKENKKLPQILNDIDLNEKNMKSWTIQNVFNYFKNKNMNQVAKVLFESKINGLALFHFNAFENLGIEDLKELNSFIDLLKNLQNHQQKQDLSKSKSIIPPEDLICPLSQKIMIDPVIAQDGNTYERKSIEEWFNSGNNTSPITREQIETFLIPNNAIKKFCEKWRNENKK